MTQVDPAPRAPRVRGASPVQGLAMLAGLVLLVLGACGLIPGVTAAGPDADLLFGVFAVSGLWNLLHLLTGAVAVFATRSTPLSARFLIVGGAFYVLAGVYGLLPVPRSVAVTLPSNTAAVCLDFALGVAMLILGTRALRREKRRGTRR